MGLPYRNSTIYNSSNRYDTRLAGVGAGSVSSGQAQTAITYPGSAISSATSQGVVSTIVQTRLQVLSQTVATGTAITRSLTPIVGAGSAKAQGAVTFSIKATFTVLANVYALGNARLMIASPMAVGRLYPLSSRLRERPRLIHPLARGNRLRPQEALC